MVALRAHCRCLEALIIDVAVDQEMNCILTFSCFCVKSCDSSCHLVQDVYNLSNRQSQCRSFCLILPILQTYYRKQRKSNPQISNSNPID